MRTATGDRARDVLRGAGLLAALALSGVSILDPDLPWHLSAARRLVETRALPRADFLSWTMGGKPWVDFEWGSELAFYGLERMGGSAALWLFRSAALFGLTLAFLGLLRLWKLPKIWEALAAPALAGALFPLFGLRPEIFSLLLFMLEFHLLERRRTGRLKIGAGRFALLHAGLYAAWANLHAGFPAGLLLCACYGLGEMFSRPEETVPLSFLAAGAGLAGTLATPYGPGLYAVLFEHWRHVGSLRRLITEWNAPTFFQAYLTGYWLILVAAFAGLLAASVRGQSLPAEHVAVVVAFAFFGSRAIRGTPYAILTAAPLGLWAWSRLSLPPISRRPVLLAALVAAVVVPWRGYHWARDMRFFGWPEPLAAQGPSRAVEFLRREKAVLAGLKMYNSYNWGGILGYGLFPDYKVFIDGRYLFADLLAEVDAAQDSPRSFRSFIDRYGVALAVQPNDGLMLRDPSDPSSLSARPYLAAAWPRAQWALVYWDSDAVVLVRRSAVPAGWLARREFRCLRPHDLRQIGLYVVGGALRLQDVEAEIARYRREIGDPRESAELESWFERFRGNFPAPRRR